MRDSLASREGVTRAIAQQQEVLIKSIGGQALRSLASPIAARYSGASGLDKKTRQGAENEYAGQARNVVQLLTKSNDLQSMLPFASGGYIRPRREQVVSWLGSVTSASMPKLPPVDVSRMQDKAIAPAEPKQRKSSLAIEGSPYKDAPEDAGAKRGPKPKAARGLAPPPDDGEVAAETVGSHENLSQALSRLPALLASLGKAAESFTSNEQSRIKQLEKDLEESRAANAALQKQLETGTAERHTMAKSHEVALDTVNAGWRTSSTNEATQKGKVEVFKAQLEDARAQRDQWHEMYENLVTSLHPGAKESGSRDARPPAGIDTKKLQKMISSMVTSAIQSSPCSSSAGSGK